MGCHVEATGFVGFAYAQRPVIHFSHHAPDNECARNNEYERYQDACELASEQRGVTGVDEPSEVGPGKLWHAEYAGEQAANYAADRVAAEGVERVVVPDAAFRD